MWNVEESRRLVKLLFGSEQLLQCHMSWRSVGERLRHARYHYQLAEKLFGEIADAHIDEHRRQFVFAGDANAWFELHDAMMEVEANCLASAHCIHAVADTLAHVVYFGLGVNLGPNKLKEDRVSMGAVLEAFAALGSEYKHVMQSLASLQSDPAFSHVSAVVNVSKHRGMPESVVPLDRFGESEPVLLEFGEFQYKGVARPRVLIRELLEPAYLTASRAVVETGAEMHRLLAAEETRRATGVG